jgi:glycosyltransferase involved in cell wall biosynthesis
MSTQRNMFYVLNDYKKYDSRIQVHNFRVQYGIQFLINFGLSKAKGDYVIILDHNTRMEQTRIERQVQYLLKHRAIDILATHMKIFYKEPSQEVTTLRMPENHEHIKFLLIFSNVIPLSTVMFNKKRFFSHQPIEALYYDDFDYHMWLSLLIDKDYGRDYEDANFAAIPDVLTSYRIENYESNQVYGFPFVQGSLTKTEVYELEDKKYQETVQLRKLALGFAYPSVFKNRKFSDEYIHDFSCLVLQ